MKWHEDVQETCFFQIENYYPSTVMIDVMKLKRGDGCYE